MFTIEYVKDLMWESEEKQTFSCKVKYAEFPVEHPAGINPNDIYDHIKEIWANGIAGKYGPIADYTPPPVIEQTPAPNQPNTSGTQTL